MLLERGIDRSDEKAGCFAALYVALLQDQSCTILREELADVGRGVDVLADISARSYLFC